MSPSWQERLDGDKAINDARRYDSSPSRYASGQRCLRKRYWGSEFAGVGLEPANWDNRDILFGKAIHRELEFAMTGKTSVVEHPIHQLAEVVADQTTPDGHAAAQEWDALFDGLVRTFNKFMRPILDRDYDWLASELDTITTFGDLKWRTILDGVVRRKSDGLFFNVEAKTTSWLDRLLAESRTNFQLLMEAEVMRRYCGLKPEQIGGSLLLVFNKGSKSKVERDGELVGHRRLSPFTYWWRRDSANGLSEYLLKRPAKWSGWELTPTWTVPGWYETAVANWPDEVAGQVQLWPSVSFDSERVASVIRQVQAVEGRLHAPFPTYWDDGERLDQFWPQNFANCSNDGGFNKPCPFQGCCFSPAIGRDPVGSGEYRLREAH